MLTREDKDQIFKAIIGILATYKKDTESINANTKDLIEEILNEIATQNDKLIKDFNNSKDSTLGELSADFKTKTKEIEKLSKEISKLKKDYENLEVRHGEDANEERVIQAVLAQIKLPEYKETVLDTGSDIVAKINDLPVNPENQIDASHIKNLPEFTGSKASGITKAAVQKMIDNSGAAGVTLKVEGTNNTDQGTLDLVAGTNMTITDNGDGSVTFDATGGSGSGDVVGPASATDNAIARFDSTTGKIIQNSAATIADTSGNITAGTYNGNTIGAGSTSGTNTGDQTSIAGITGTKAQFDTAVTDGNFLYVGDVTQYTDEMAQDAVGGILSDTAEIDFTYNDATPSISASIVTGSIDETKLDASTNASLDLADTSVQPNSSPTLATITTTGNIELGNASDTTLSRSAAGVLAVEGVVIPSISSTNTLTNKRVTKRTGTTTSSATPTIDTNSVDFYSLTAQTADITSFTTNLTGTPTDGQTLWIAITGTGARAITWGSSFEASTVALPTTTVSTNRLDVGFVWNAVTSKWRCVASC